MALGLVLAGLGSAHLVAAISPGPSFVVVARTSIAGSRASGGWKARYTKD